MSTRLRQQPSGRPPKLRLADYIEFATEMVELHGGDWAERNLAWLSFGGLLSTVFVIAAATLTSDFNLSRTAAVIVLSFGISYAVVARSTRVNWRPRLWMWWLLALLLALTVATTLLLIAEYDLKTFIAALDQIAAIRRVFPRGIPPAQMEATRAAVTVQTASLYLGLCLLDLCTCIAMVMLCVLSPTPRKWAAFPRFQRLLLGLAVVAGRPIAGAIFALLPAPGPTDFYLMYFPLQLVLAPLLLVFGGVLMLVGLIAWVALVAGMVVFVFVGLPLLLFDFIEAAAQRDLIRGKKKSQLTHYIHRFDFWLRHEPLPDIPDDSKGSRFSLPGEVTLARAQDGFAFGHLEGRPLFLNTSKHVLLMASTRSGKGVSVIIPHLLRHPGSAFVLDPKGENAKATGRTRSQLNRKVHYLDPFGISGLPQSRFNPLSFFTPQNMEASSKSLSVALILNERRDHWVASAQQLLAALILHVVTHPDFPPSHKDLVTVRRLLLGVLKPTLQEMQRNPAAGGLVADLAASFLATPEKELGSIISAAQRETEILDNPYIAGSLAATGDTEAVDFRVWHRDTMTCYLCLSAPKFPIFSRWLRLVLSSALDEMTDTLDPPAVPVCFMLDELATLGHLGTIENAVGLSAGYGIQLVTVWQDVAQMKDLYKGRWASFIGNSGMRAVFSIDDFDSAKYWSDFIGGHMVATQSQSQDIYGLSKGQTEGEAMRPLLSPEQIMLRFANDRMLLLPQGMRPVESERIAYWNDPTLVGLWDDPRQPARVAPQQQWSLHAAVTGWQGQQAAGAAASSRAGGPAPRRI